MLSMLYRALYPRHRYAQLPKQNASFCSRFHYFSLAVQISSGISAHITEPISPFTTTTASSTIDPTGIWIKCPPSIPSARQVQFTRRRIDLKATSPAILQQHLRTLIVYYDFPITARIHLVAVRAFLVHIAPMPIQCNADRIRE